MSKDLAEFPLCFRFISGQRHVADGALVFDMRNHLRMIERFTPDARLPVRIARRIRHDAGAPLKPNRNVLARSCFQLVMASKAAVRRLKTAPRVWDRHRPEKRPSLRDCRHAWSSPSLEQPSVLPVPEQVEHKLHGPPGRVACGNPHTDVEPDMLSFTQGDLKLRHYITIRFRAGHEIPVGDKFHHWRPEPPCSPRSD